MSTSTWLRAADLKTPFDKNFDSLQLTYIKIPHILYIFVSENVTTKANSDMQCEV